MYIYIYICAYIYIYICIIFTCSNCCADIHTRKQPPIKVRFVSFALLQQRECSGQDAAQAKLVNMAYEIEAGAQGIWEIKDKT